MSAQRPDRQNDEIVDMLIAYHLGLLDESEAASIETRISSDEELSEVSERIKSSIYPLEFYDVDVPDELYDKIIVRVHGTEITTEQIIQRIAEEPIGKRKIIFRRLADFIATAASIALIVSAILLSTSHIRHQTRKAICAGNLGIVGSSIASYANDFPNQLPYSKVSVGKWYDNAHKRARRPHLFILVKHRYLDPKFLICPEDRCKPVNIQITHNVLESYNDFPEGSVVSYSFQNLFGDTRFSPRERYLRWERAQQLAIMADRNPLLKSSGTSLRLPVDVNKMLSPNHIKEYGQNILSLDGHVVWQKSPLFGIEKDNIWQAGNIKEYHGTETPVNATDVFLAP